MKKILLLFCGGTIAMIPDEKTGALVPAKSAEDLLGLVPKVRENVDLDVIELFNIDSTNIMKEHWIKIISVIRENYEKYDGFVITHGTDTMVDTACALSFAFGGGLSKSIVLTGSQSHSDVIGTDAKFNLENVFRVVEKGVSEVMISFGHYVFRGVRAQKRHDSDYNAFYSPNYPVLGTIRSDISWGREIDKMPSDEVLTGVCDDFEDGILYLKVNAAVCPEIISNVIDGGEVRGIIFESLGAGNIPTRYLDVVRKSVGKNIPVLIASSFAGGSTHAGTYELGYEALRAGAIETGDMTPAAVYVKLMWCLAYIDKKIEEGVLDEKDFLLELKNMFGKSYVGEITV